MGLNNMKSPQIALVYDRKKVASPQKAASVEIRLTYERKVKYLTTGVKLFPKEWNGKVVNRLDCVILQERLDEMVKRIQLIINDMMKTGNINLDQIPSLLKILERDSISFMDFCEEKVKVRTYGLKDDTADRYERFMKFFRKWGKIVWFSDLTEKNILLMDAELAKKNMKAKSKWHNYHRFLNSFIIDAISEGLTKKNPYKAVRIDKGEDGDGIEKYLTKKEFEKICKAECLEIHINYLVTHTNRLSPSLLISQKSTFNPSANSLKRHADSKPLATKCMGTNILTLKRSMN